MEHIKSTLAYKLQIMYIQVYTSKENTILSRYIFYNTKCIP